MLHPQILLHPLHPLLPLRIHVRIIVLPIQPLHDVLLKVLQQIDLGLELVRVLGGGVRLSDVYRPSTTGGNVVKVPRVREEWSAQRSFQQRRTNGEAGRRVESDTQIRDLGSQKDASDRSAIIITNETLCKEE
jgi:hypothetical protein